MVKINSKGNLVGLTCLQGLFIMGAFVSKLRVVPKGKLKKQKLSAFTLAEMMIVLLVLSLVTAAFLPVITTKSKITSTGSPWRYVSSGTGDIYYGNPNTTQGAAIGATDLGGNLTRLLINTRANGDQNDILFQQDGTTRGHLMVDGSFNIGLGNVVTMTNATNAVAIGATVTSLGHDSVAMGENSSANSDGAISISGNATGAESVAINGTTNGGSAVAIGGGSSATFDDNVSVGSSSRAIGNSGSTAVGHLAHADEIQSAAFGFDSQATGKWSTAIGNSSRANGTSSVAVGNSAITISHLSTAIGNGASASGDTANNAVAGTALGASSNAFGAYSTALGSGLYAGAFAKGSYSVAVGSDAKAYANCSIAMGQAAAAGNSSSMFTAFNSIAIGQSTIASASFATVVGYSSTASGESSTAIGNNAKVIGTESIAFGKDSYAQGTGSIAIGSQACQNFKSGGDYNVAIGYQALKNDTNGGGGSVPNYNVAIGGGALINNIDGAVNTAIGGVALGSNKNGSYNTAVGDGSGYNVTGNNKTCIGYNAGPTSGSTYATDSQERIFIGSQSKFNGGAALLEVHNTSNGNDSASGQNDINVQRQHSGDANTATVVINGDLVVKGNTWITSKQYGNPGYGIYSVEHNDGPSDQIEIGYWSQGPGSGNGSAAPTYSDRRLKTDIKEDNFGLEQIRKLQVFDYIFKKDKQKNPHVGVIAQDLQKVFPNSVKKDTKGYLMLRQEDMFYAMVNSIKQLDTIVQGLVKDVKDIVLKVQSINDKLVALISVNQYNSKKIKTLEAKNRGLESRLVKLEKMVKQ